MRLVDADALEYQLGISDRDIYCKEVISDAPTVETKTVIHGHWSDEIGDIHSTGKFRVCSNCGESVFIPYFSIQGINKVDFEYCPNCNATMDE